MRLKAPRCCQFKYNKNVQETDYVGVKEAEGEKIKGSEAKLTEQTDGL